jgi:hypothetical protein
MGAVDSRSPSPYTQKVRKFEDGVGEILPGMYRNALIVLALAGVGAVAVASAASGGRHPAAVTIHAQSKLDHVQLVENAPQGRSAGDVLVFTEQLLDAKGHQIGSDAATCTYLFDQRSQCTGTYVLPGGQVMVQLIQPGPTGTYTQAIVGGTGRYARATGVVVVDQQSGGDRFTFRIRL